MQKMHLSSAVYHASTEPVQKWAPTAGAQLRMVASQYRAIAGSHKKLEVYFKQVFCRVVNRHGQLCAIWVLSFLLNAWVVMFVLYEKSVAIS